MSKPAIELRILHRKAIYPETTGGNLRTMNIARLSRGVIGQTTVFSMDNHMDFEVILDEIHIIQEKELHSVLEMIKYYTRAITAKELIVPYTNRAFKDSDNALFQIEDPLLYPLIKKKKISRFILDEHNVNWEMFSTPQPNIKKRIYAKIAFSRDKENEKMALRHAVHVICCSYRDRDILVSEVPDIAGRISVIPNCVNIREFDSNQQFAVPPQKGQKSRILFVGTLSHPPNSVAVGLICQIIAPLCSGNYQFIIVGKNPPLINHPQNVHFSGYISNLKQVIAEADICIAPIRSGSGTRLKILEYMAMGKPVISTSKGAEGIEYTDGLNIIIEDTIDKYPEIIRQLLDDEKKRGALGREARKLIEEKYNWDLYRKPLEKIYRRVKEEIE
jgi:glycosyltransferase involved in cell wall biosynthesis